MVEIRGVIQKGVGQGAYFTVLDWVVEQFERAMGEKPFPGTLNVRVSDEDIPKLEAFFSKKDFEIVPRDTQFCSAALKKVKVNGLLGAAVFPSQDVRIHGKEVIEVMSSLPIKKTLQLSDGDEVIISSLDSGLQQKG